MPGPSPMNRGISTPVMTASAPTRGSTRGSMIRNISNPNLGLGNHPLQRMGNSTPDLAPANRSMYAIDFNVDNCGKHFRNTKRRIRWHFGFVKPAISLAISTRDLSTGDTAPMSAYRGEWEHDVTLLWSVYSGKRLILMDGKEIHHENNRGAVIDFSFTMQGRHTVRIVAHANAPMTDAPQFRQYDLFIDGRTFTTIPEVHR